MPVGTVVLPETVFTPEGTHIELPETVIRPSNSKSVLLALGLFGFICIALGKKKR